MLLGIVLLSSCVRQTSLATAAVPRAAPQAYPVPSPPPLAPSIDTAEETSSELEPLELAGEMPTQPREIFRQGYRLYHAKKYSAARPLLQRAVDNYPVLADYSLYYLATLQREDGQTAEAKQLFQRLLSEHPDSIWSGHATLELAKLAAAERSWEQAAQYAKQTRETKNTPATIRQEALLVLARAQEGQSRVGEAYNLYQELRRSTPRSATGQAAKEHVERLRSQFPEQFALTDDHAYLDELRLLHKEGENADVDALARRFQAQFPSSPLRSEVLMLLAGIYKQQGRVNEAVAAWKEIAEISSGSALAPVALFNWATLLWNKDRDEEAKLVFERLAQQFSRHEKAAEAWYAIGRIWQERNDESRAATAYDRLAALFPEAALAREGRWRQGWMAYRRGDFSQAKQKFGALAKSASSTPEGESAFYWQARAQERLGDTEKATTQFREFLRRYPDGYYASLVERRLNLTPPPLKPGPERTGTAPSFPPQLDRHYRRSQELVFLGLPALAKRELDVVRDGVPRDTAGSLFLLSEYSRMNGHAAALRFAQELAKGGGSWLRYLYPQAYWSKIGPQARTKGIDPYLVLALMRQESLFDPEAVSPAHAYGLMQLLPKTAARVTYTPAVAPSALTDPEFNIAAGTSYLHQLLTMYNGNATMAIAAYNAGEGAVDKWRARYVDVAPDEFVESISYRETRNYVKLVMRNYRMYRRLYGEQPAS
ncbi:MAG: transglycosylase SLT domain-containing protein [Deltaproteobacteria bacterium]|nr:transglycosylase SLT domain-containing protein [Deltaproteobacteria bacterium]